MVLPIDALRRGEVWVEALLLHHASGEVAGRPLLLRDELVQLVLGGVVEAVAERENGVLELEL